MKWEKIINLSVLYMFVNSVVWLILYTVVLKVWPSAHCGGQEVFLMSGLLQPQNFSLNAWMRATR